MKILFCDEGVPHASSPTSFLPCKSGLPARTRVACGGLTRGGDGSMFSLTQQVPEVTGVCSIQPRSLVVAG